VLFSHGSNKAVMVPDSRRVTNGNSIRADVTDDANENHWNDACVIYFQTIWQLFWVFWYFRINTTCVHKINLHSPRKMLEKLGKGSLFYLLLKLVQINYIFSDNVRILYIYYVLHDILYYWSRMYINSSTILPY